MEDILLPHETMIRLAGSKALMPGYHAVHGTKCVANSEILNDICEIISDSMEWW